MIRDHFPAVLVAALCLGACASTPEKLKGAEFYFAEGQKALSRKRCLEAVEHFQRLVSNFPGSQRVAEAQYLLAESYFCARDFVNAAFEYQRLLDVYPASEWADEAQFKIGESYYKQMRRPELDQKETYEALSAFRYFIEDHPDSPLVEEARARIAACRDRLAEKQYRGARLYQRQGYLEAARLTYEEVLRDYSDTAWYYPTLFHLGEIARARGDVDGAVRYWREVLEHSDDGDLLEKVREALSTLGDAAG